MTDFVRSSLKTLPYHVRVRARFGRKQHSVIGWQLRRLAAGNVQHALRPHPVGSGASSNLTLPRYFDLLKSGLAVSTPRWIHKRRYRPYSGPVFRPLPALSQRLVLSETNDKMQLISLLVNPYMLLALPILYYLLPYLRNWSIRAIPAPFPAAFTNLWLMYVTSAMSPWQLSDL